MNKMFSSDKLSFFVIFLRVQSLHATFDRSVFVVGIFCTGAQKGLC